MARLYRVEMTLSQKDLIEFIDQNPGYKASITAAETPPEQGGEQPTYTPARVVQRRKRRTKAQIEADRMPKAAE